MQFRAHLLKVDPISVGSVRYLLILAQVESDGRMETRSVVEGAHMGYPDADALRASFAKAKISDESTNQLEKAFTLNPALAFVGVLILDSSQLRYLGFKRLQESSISSRLNANDSTLKTLEATIARARRGPLGLAAAASGIVMRAGKQGRRNIAVTDNLNRLQRSILMSHVRGKDTNPEKLLRSALHRAGYRYSLHREDLPGKPDLVFRSRRKIIFIHGCFWHGHRNCNQGRLAKSNRPFWAEKLAKNRARDRRVERELCAAGWKIHVVWTCRLRSAQKMSDTIARVTHFLEN